MKIRFTSLAIVIALVLFQGCADNSNEVSRPASGYFVLSQLQLPSNARKSGTTQVTDDVRTDFNLGDLKASREFFFALSNGGDNSIFDITLETDDPDFIISPTEISNLNGVNASTGSIIPLVSLGVVHGKHINGIGFTDVLQKGMNDAVVTLKGKTIENGDTIELESKFNFAVHASVMDISFFNDETEIDITNPYSEVVGVSNTGGLGSIPTYYLASRNISMSNTGNVDILVTIVPFYQEEQAFDFVLKPGDSSSEIELPELEPGNFYALISLNGNGTISAQNRIRQGNDGNGYFNVQPGF